MSIHAFVDESGRGGRYLVCVHLVKPARLTVLRKQLKSMLLPGQRELHFKNERPQQQRALADRIARLEVSVRIYTAIYSSKSEENARQMCLQRAVEDLLIERAQRLVLDTRDTRNIHDIRTLQRTLGSHPSKTELVYEHVDSVSEPLLWVSDAVAWCYGAGGDWKRRVMATIDNVHCLE